MITFLTVNVIPCVLLVSWYDYHCGDNTFIEVPLFELLNFYQEVMWSGTRPLLPSHTPLQWSLLYLWASWTWRLVWFLSSSQFMWLGYYTCSTFFFFGNKLLSYTWRMVGWMILSTYPISPYLLQGYLLVWLS